MGQAGSQDAVMVSIEGVGQVFRSGFWMKKVAVLHEIDFQIPKKSVFGFLGANGAGKTTLIQLMVGLRSPSTGRILIDGELATTRQARRRIGYLPERPYFYEHLTGEGLLHYFGVLSGLSQAVRRTRMSEVLEAVGMLHARKLELRRYSKGMLQRIGIAQAILHNPRFLVLDEPMSGLDPAGRKEMRELIGKLSQEGRTVFFSSHVIPDVEAICDQVALIEKGRLIGCGPIGHFINDKNRPLQTEIICTGIGVQEAQAVNSAAIVRAIPEGVRIVMTGQAEVNAALPALVAARASVVSVTPVRPSLESFFEKGK